MKSWKLHSSERSGADRWGLWVALALAAATAVLLLSSLARAQEPPELPELVLEPCPDAGALRALQLDDGTPGLWFPRATAQCLLGRVTTLQEAVPYIRLLESRLRLDDERNALQERRVALADQQSTAATEALEAAVRRAREAEEDRDAWHRSPALWFTIGVVATVVLEVVAIWAISEVSR